MCICITYGACKKSLKVGRAFFSLCVLHRSFISEFTQTSFCIPRVCVSIEIAKHRVTWKTVKPFSRTPALKSYWNTILYACRILVTKYPSYYALVVSVYIKRIASETFIPVGKRALRKKRKSSALFNNYIFKNFPPQFFSYLWSHIHIHTEANSDHCTSRTPSPFRSVSSCVDTRGYGDIYSSLSLSTERVHKGNDNALNDILRPSPKGISISHCRGQFRPIYYACCFRPCCRRPSVPYLPILA